MRDQERQLPERYLVLDNALSLILSMYRWPLGLTLAIGAVSGLVLGIVADYVGEDGPPFFGAILLAYLILGPVVLGYLTVRHHPNPSWAYRVVAPMVVTLVMGLCLSAVCWDASVIVVCVIQIQLCLSWLGAVLGWWRLLRGRNLSVH